MKISGEQRGIGMASVQRVGYAKPMYEARKVCNLLLSKYSASEFDLTNLRMNKLLYFIHAAALLVRPDGLIRNHFEAWQHGPVVRPVYDAFKVHGESFIDQPAMYLDYGSGQRRPVPFDDIDADAVVLIAEVFERYARFSTGQLVALSHERDGPWDLIHRAQLADPTASPRIPNELIRQHFKGGGISASRH